LRHKETKSSTVSLELLKTRKKKAIKFSALLFCAKHFKKNCVRLALNSPWHYGFLAHPVGLLVRLNSQ
jgi:hypothetical protein